MNKIQSKIYTVSQEQLNKFAILSGGTGAIHTDPEYAKETVFKKPLVHGLYLLALIEKEARLQGFKELDVEVTFLKPVLVEQAFTIVFDQQEDNSWIIKIETNDSKVVVGTIY